MRYSSVRGPVPFLALALAAVSAGCVHRIPEVSPADIPKLEQASAANPQDTDLKVQLGMAQYKAKQFDQARANLQAAVDSGNTTGVGFLYLGMTDEYFQDWSAARDAYQKYLTTGRSDALKGEIRSRLELIAQKVLKQQAQQALAQEARISAAPPTPHSVAVFPFGFNSSNQDLQPLVYALSDMMTTDFSVSNAVTVLERSKIQSLLDEMSLTEAGYADPATGARAGRLLHAENVVQGVITTVGSDELRLDDDVLNTTRAASEGTLTSQDQLNKLFDIEKDLVFRTLRDVLGVQLTPAEEQKIRENRASNVLAFVAYGKGLEARDHGDYQAALQNFKQAQQLDPSFAPASTAASTTQDLTTAAGTSTSDITQMADNSETGGGTVSGPGSDVTGSAAGAGSSTSDAASNASDAVNPNRNTTTLDQGSTQTGGDKTNTSGASSDRKTPTQQATGTDAGATNKATIILTIPRPGTGGGF